MHSVKKAAKPKSASNKLPVAAHLPTMPQPETPKQADYEKRERQYKIEDALGTIERAEKYRADKELMRDVKKMAKEKMKQLGKIC